ncbi:helix-turn-helix transcriptional regulator [Alicyclobacillus mengziensis]|uniref:Helix-turn-helix transcriptional regulator n=1 Tax=Alicyclobacillus mengziensis TaxID=2931921 RepID=A0A9X7VYD6_9BACL|nr:helix-turn-helix transcriptional regulator [Alicyclobacillus mengziensis]QSO47338.1 helix-turn-helix transcriptional regulator [Alicyclobacillus mengziensis]
MENCIRTLREERSWTQGQLGSQVGVTRQTILFIEKGKYVPSLPLALKLSKVFNRTVNELFWLDTTD